jgi:hypothetical protein
MKLKKTAFATVLVSLAVVACIRPSSNSHRIPPDTPTLGNLNGISMTIPYKYQFFPIEYEGDDIWDAEWEKKNRNRIAKPDMKIRAFSLLLHLPDYAPLSNENGYSWRHNKTPYEFNPDWITVGVTWNNNRAKLMEKDWFRRYVERSKEANLMPQLANWHYEIADENIYGLIHERLVGPTPTDFLFSSQSTHKDFYSDAQHRTSKIECQRMHVKPFAVTTCEQTYVIPELDSFITIEYNQQHLTEWRQLQDKVSLIIEEFENNNVETINHH